LAQLYLIISQVLLTQRENASNVDIFKHLNYKSQSITMLLVHCRHKHSDTGSVTLHNVVQQTTTIEVIIIGLQDD